MDEIKDEIKLIRESQVRMEADIQYHIKRTDLLESQVHPVYKAFVGIKWAIGSIITLAALTAAIIKLKGL